MKSKIWISCLLCCLGVTGLWAQAPKWIGKAKQAVFSVVTYDNQGKMLNTGNGFFISEDGVAVSDYSLFKGAHRAVVLTSAGKEWPVEAIMGADDMYDIVKFRVGTGGKEVSSLPVVSSAPAVGAPVYLLPYSTQKDRSFTEGKVKAVDVAGENNHYYTLDLRLKDKMVSCPAMTAEGQVFGLAQKSSGSDTATLSYAVDARLAASLQISALSYGDLALRHIGIKKALPDTEEQALVFLYMAAAQVDSVVYAQILEDFIHQYPHSADGYLRRATLALSKGEKAIQDVKSDLDHALAVAKKKDDVYYQRAKLIYNYLLLPEAKPVEGWTLDEALKEVEQAIAIQPLPVYLQLEGDIRFADKDYAGALQSYEKVNQTNLKSAATWFSLVRTREMLQAPKEEVLALMDSCVAQYTKPYVEAAAPYLLERAQRRLSAGKARLAVVDYDDYLNARSGQVNDLFYYYRSQAAVQAKQYQRALDDLAKAIEMNPKELLYRAELAALNIRVGRNEEAIRVLKETLTVDASYAEAYRLMGLAYVQLKQKKDACICFAKAKELGDPNVEELIKKHCN